MQVCYIDADASEHLVVTFDETASTISLLSNIYRILFVNTLLVSYVAGILRANHYIGSFAQYSSRVDPRRSKEKFNKFGNVNYGSDHQIQNWLKDFIGVVGVEKSKNLLKHAGIVDIGTTRIIETESYKRVPQPPKYYVYYYDINDQIVGRKRLEKGEINNSEFGLDEIVEQNQLK